MRAARDRYRRAHPQILRAYLKASEGRDVRLHIVRPLRATFDLTPALQRAGYDVPPAILLREGYAKRLDVA